MPGLGELGLGLGEVVHMRGVREAPQVIEEIEEQLLVIGTRDQTSHVSADPLCQI